MRCSRAAWWRRSSRSGPRSLPGFARHERSPRTRWAPSPRSLPRAGSSPCTSPVMNRRPRLLSRIHARRRRCPRRQLTSPHLGGACVIRCGRPCWCPAALKALAWRCALPAGEEFSVPLEWPLAALPGEHRARMGPFWPRGRPARSAAQSSKPRARAIAEADSEMPDGTGHQRRPGLRAGRF